MAYSERLADRVRTLLAGRRDVVERKMFGGLAFMVSGHMCCGIMGEALMARVGAEQYEEALARPHARIMDFTGKPMKGMVIVGPEGCDRQTDLDAWVRRCEAFVATLPPKA